MQHEAECAIQHCFSNYFFFVNKRSVTQDSHRQHLRPFCYVALETHTNRKAERLKD